MRDGVAQKTGWHMAKLTGGPEGVSGFQGSGGLPIPARANVWISVPEYHPGHPPGVPSLGFRKLNGNGSSEILKRYIELNKVGEVISRWSTA